MRSAFRIAVLVLPLGLSAACARAVDTTDRVVDPTDRVGAITETTSEADLLIIYGPKAVSRAAAADDKSAMTVLFAGTPDEVQIEWKNAFRSPRRITIDGGDWKTPEGIAVGAPLADLEKANGGPFDVTGSNWDRPIRVVSWKGGKLAPRLQIDLGPADPATPLSKALKSRRSFFESTSPTLRKANLVVKRLILEW